MWNLMVIFFFLFFLVFFVNLVQLFKIADLPELWFLDHFECAEFDGDFHSFRFFTFICKFCPKSPFDNFSPD